MEEGAPPTPELPGRPVSLWLDTAPAPVAGPLRGDRDFDVAVVGGGIAGLTAAVLLQEAGAKVALIEARTLAGGVSGHTTAKLTILHGLAYQRLVAHGGAARAKLYAEANDAGLRRVARRVPPPASMASKARHRFLGGGAP